MLEQIQSHPTASVVEVGPLPVVQRGELVERLLGLAPGLVKLTGAGGETVAVVPAAAAEPGGAWAARIAADGLAVVPVNANERIAALTEAIEASGALADLEWLWTGDQEEQEESQQFLTQAFGAALGLMFIILLAQFNSFYNAALVLVAVVLSTTGVLIGMMVMQQPFSIIMTGTGIVALAGIVVNNNIVLIDTYQEFSRYMPRLEAITRTAEQRLRPVLLTTITTMAGLTPMMFGLSIDFFGGGYSIDSPTALWWKQLATAVVFGLGIATVLTLVLTPALLSVRVWAGEGAYRAGRGLGALILGRDSPIARDVALMRAARRAGSPTLVFEPADFALPIASGAPVLPPVLPAAPVARAAAATREAAPLEARADMPPPPPLRAAE